MTYATSPPSLFWENCSVEEDDDAAAVAAGEGNLTICEEDCGILSGRRTTPSLAAITMCLASCTAGVSPRAATFSTTVLLAPCLAG